jgi:hypothetical protein
MNERTRRAGMGVGSWMRDDSHDTVWRQNKGAECLVSDDSIRRKVEPQHNEGTVISHNWN